MKGFLIRRLSLLLAVALVVVTIVFSFLRLIPGDPVEAMLGENALPADVAGMRKELMLDRPLGQQYVQYLLRIAHGDLGKSWSMDAPVSELILQKLPATAVLASAGLLVAVLISFPLGIFGARRPNSWGDRGASVLAVMGVAIPHFWLGPMLILLFSIQLGWLPVSGYGTVAQLVLPAVTLGSGLAAILTRMLRAGLIEELRSDYARTARAKGGDEKRIIFRHALRNAILPVVTILGLQLGSLLTGAIITESIFAWPGIGRLLIQAIFSRDYPLVQGCILVFALIYAAVNLLVDVVYASLDPRIQL